MYCLHDEVKPSFLAVLPRYYVPSPLTHIITLIQSYHHFDPEWLACTTYMMKPNHPSLLRGSAGGGGSVKYAMGVWFAASIACI